MRNIRAGVVVASVAACIVGGALAAEKPNLVGTFKDWHVYSAGKGKTRTCYALSVPKEMNQLSCAAFIAGVIEGVCDGAGFPCKASSHNAGTEIWPNRTVFLVKFEDSVLEREKELEAIGVK